MEKLLEIVLAFGAIHMQDSKAEADGPIPIGLHSSTHNPQLKIQIEF
jgi:hypothetical protein